MLQCAAMKEAGDYKHVRSTIIAANRRFSLKLNKRIYYFHNAYFKPIMKLKTFILVALCAANLISRSAFAQLPLEWAISGGSNNTTFRDDGNAITTDASGNIYITGSFAGTTDFDPGPGTYNLTPTGTVDVFVQKLDAAGNFVWAINFGSSTTVHCVGNEIAIGPDGNIYTSGVFNSTVDFNTGAGTFNMTAVGASDAYLLCLDPNAAFLWAARFGGNGGGEHIYTITFDEDSNLLAGGDFQASVDFDPGAGSYNLTSFGLYDGFVLKLDIAGNFIWAGRIGGSGGSEVVNEITTDTAGNVYTSGTFEGLTDFDPTVGVSNLASDGNGEPFLAKWTGNCTLVWARQIRGIPNANGTSIAVDAAGNVYGTGRFWGISDFDGGPGTATTAWHGDYDIYVIKLDAAGLFRWAVGIGSTSEDYGRRLTLDEEANIYVGGYFTGTVDFDPGSGVANATSNPGIFDAFLLKLDSSGNYQWVKDLSGTGSVQIFDLKRDANGSIYTVGNFGLACDFDPDAGITNLTSNGGQDFFVQKFYECNNAGYTISPVTCDSFVSPSGLHTWTTSGTYFDTIVNPAACDSAQYVVTVNLTITPPTSATINTTACFSYTAPDNMVYTTSGTYIATIPNSTGCDSVITINLTIDTVDVSLTQVGLTLTAGAAGAQYQWINCTTNSIIPGETGQSYVVTVNGTYAVIVTQNSCTDTSICYLVNSVDIETYTGESIQAYPNPVQNLLTVTSDKAGQVRLFNVAGELTGSAVITNKITEIDVSMLPDGVYFLEVTTAEITLVRRIVIAR